MNDLFACLALALVLFCSCSPSPKTDTSLTGSAADNIVWEYLTIDGEPAPANPITGDQTLPEYNKINYFRYRTDTGNQPPAEVSAVLMLIPGYTVGASYLTYFARSMIDARDGDLEVWIIEHRHNLLEDHTGLMAAQEKNNLYLAFDYYFGTTEIDGKSFSGFLDPYNSDTAMMSEWSLELKIKDINRVLSLIPEQQRSATVFLGGHSRGAAYAKAYSAYIFEDGHQGCDDLAGLVMIDGDSLYNNSFNEAKYTDSLDKLRSGEEPRYAIYLTFGPEIYLFTNIVGMVASEKFSSAGDPRLGPDGIFGDLGPLEPFLPLLFRNKDIRMTNEALFGFMTDKESSSIELLRGGMGKLNGPTKTDSTGSVYPTDEEHLYSWLKFNDVTPREFVDIQDVANSIVIGPSNFSDYYYSNRHNYDLWASDNLETEGTWRDKYFTFSNSTMDIPVFILGTRLLSERMEQIDMFRNQLPPVRGQDLPRNQYGFEVMLVPEWEHLDSVFAKAESNQLFARLKDWIGEFSSDSVIIP
jgi:hypothetical protein